MKPGEHCKSQLDRKKGYAAADQPVTVLHQIHKVQISLMQGNDPADFIKQPYNACFLIQFFEDGKNLLNILPILLVRHHRQRFQNLFLPGRIRLKRRHMVQKYAILCTRCPFSPDPGNPEVRRKAHILRMLFNIFIDGTLRLTARNRIIVCLNSLGQRLPGCPVF